MECIEENKGVIFVVNEYPIIIDKELLPFIMERSWYANTNERTGITYICSNRSTEEGLGLIYLHRYIFGDIPEGIEIDHINHNTLDCQRSNLRLATRSQNNINRIMPQGYFGSGYRGVSETPAGRFRVSLRIEGRITSFGVYPTAEEAACVYDEAARKHHGEFAVLNFPDPEKVI